MRGEEARETGPRPLIVLVRQRGDELLMAGVRSEALRFGWEVSDTATVPGGLSRDTSVALIRYLEAPRGAHLWIRGAGPRASPVEEWVVRVDGDPDDILAIRVVEVLRAHFLLLDPGPPAPHPGEGPKAPAPTSTPSVLWGSLAVGCAGYVSTGGFEPMGGFVLGAKLGLRGWMAGVQTTWQLGDSTVREPEGAASVKTLGVAAYVGRQAPLGAGFHGFAGLGAAVWQATIHGVAAPPYVSRSSSAWSAGPAATLGVEHAPSPGFRLGLGLHGGVLVPPLSVQFVQREAAQWGAPFGLLAVYGAVQF